MRLCCPTDATHPFADKRAGFEACTDDVAGMAGLEPAMRESKSLALPLGYTPVLKRGKAGAEAPAFRLLVGWAIGLTNIRELIWV